MEKKYIRIKEFIVGEVYEYGGVKYKIDEEGYLKQENTLGGGEATIWTKALIPYNKAIEMEFYKVD